MHLMDLRPENFPHYHPDFWEGIHLFQLSEDTFFQVSTETEAWRSSEGDGTDRPYFWGLLFLCSADKYTDWQPPASLISIPARRQNHVTLCKPAPSVRGLRQQAGVGENAEALSPEVRNSWADWQSPLNHSHCCWASWTDRFQSLRCTSLSQSHAIALSHCMNSYYYWNS